MMGTSVQRGTLALPAVSALIPIDPVDLAHSVVLVSHTADTSTGVYASQTTLEGHFVNDATIELRRQRDGVAITVSWEVVTLPFAVTHGVTTMGPGVAVVTEPVAGLVPESAVAIATSQSLFGQATGSTTYLEDDFDRVGEAAVALTVGSGMVSLERSTARSSTTVAWAAIDFSRAPCAAR